MQDHQDLYQLLSEDKQARKFYASLPFDMQQGLRYSSEDIKTFEDLQTYAVYLK